MKVFHCGHCDQLVFFENTSCVNCGRVLAYLPDRNEVDTLETAGPGAWRPSALGAQGPLYRLCRNYNDDALCNWAVPADDPDPYCRSCRLTRTIPDLDRPGSLEAWRRLETAKRRLVYSLILLKLPLAGKADDPTRGLAFDFLADPDPGTPGAAPVLTGHAGGLIVINIAEADDATREHRRNLMHEPYRTILGHFRHEIGHYYWDRLIRDDPGRLGEYRELFGDERQDYGEAIRRHHARGAPADWPDSFVSAYASAHPWEDWAETWAHYLHITDTLETALCCGISLRPKRSNEPAMTPDIALSPGRLPSFDDILDRWFPLTYVLNNLNRGMGMADAYPFVLPGPALRKLGFIHEVIAKFAR